MTVFEKTTDAAKGKWRGILSALGVPSERLVNKHGPCPMCGGVDRFRYDNRSGEGTWICSVCGAGSGIQLAMAFRGWDFATAAKEVDAVIGNAVGCDPASNGLTDERRRELLREVSRGSAQTVPGDVVDRYLAARGVNEPVIYPKAMRTHPGLRYDDGASYPAMVAVVSDVDGKPINLHRTWLGEGCKAPVSEPRKLMPGTMPEGACVRLSEPQGCLGVAEGIETALAASHRFQMPVWAALSASMLAKWWPPEGVSEVTIYGDCDPSAAGQAAAWTLARRLIGKKIKATVVIPPNLGEDWNDVVARENM